MGFLFSVKGLRAIGVTQRPFVGLLSQLESSTRFGFVGCGIGSRGFVLRGIRSDVFWASYL